MTIEERYRRLRHDMRGRDRTKAAWWIAEDPWADRESVTVEVPIVDAGEACSYCKGPLRVARFTDPITVSYYFCEKCGITLVGMPAAPPLYLADIPVEWLEPTR